MVWIAFDDTDSRAGGCTTHLAARFLAGLEGIDAIGAPRLVRLNPNVPHRTRGNGAISIRLGHGHGASMPIGSWKGMTLTAWPKAEPLSPREEDAVFHEAVAAVEANASLGAPDTHPAVVMTRHPPDEAFYRAAVHRYVGMREADDVLGELGARWAGWKRGRGRLGAVAAVSWAGRVGTYEAISYRPAARWGTKRRIPTSIGPDLDTRFPASFDNWDPINEHLRIAPTTPCPVLAGVRATDPAQALAGVQSASQEDETEGSVLFWTNQASDDHRLPLSTAALRPFASASVEATVAGEPHVRPGGHVFVRVQDATGPLDVAAFEPTKQFRTLVRRLREGDVVRVHGGVHEDPTLLSLERLDLLQAVPRPTRRAPECSSCNRRMASRGSAEGYRCEGCGARQREPERSYGPAPVVASYEVPVLVRRHLARPLCLGPRVAA